MANASEQRVRYTVTVDQYVQYHRDGYIIAKGLLPPEDVARLKQWVDDIYHGKINLDHLSPVFDWMSEQQKTERLVSARIHMPHREDATAEWALLHPRVLDVLESLIGPDVLALQSMLFINPPGKGGQGWHQDSYYIQTQPDTLIGAWIAIDRADEKNGCLWVAPGSHCEPVYPPEIQYRGGYVHADERLIEGLFPAKDASKMDDNINELSKVAAKYGKAVPAVLEPGDVLFFHSHLLHRSYRNETKDSFRRSYVCHYCNARSWVPWTHGEPFEGESGNSRHILARGRTHLPYAKPAFGTKVELAPPPAEGKTGSAINVAMPGGGMGIMEM